MDRFEILNWKNYIGFLRCVHTGALISRLYAAIVVTCCWCVCLNCAPEADDSERTPAHRMLQYDRFLSSHNQKLNYMLYFSPHFRKGTIQFHVILTFSTFAFTMVRMTCNIFDPEGVREGNNSISLFFWIVWNRSGKSRKVDLSWILRLVLLVDYLCNSHLWVGFDRTCYLIS
jgi:hypothetical protein